MDKIEWLTLLSKRNTGKTPARPFSAKDPGGSALYATDRVCIVRVPCSEAEATKYKIKDPYLDGFFDVMTKLYEGTQFKGTLDALLLKEMAGDADWQTTESKGCIKLDGGYFSKSVIARAMAGWKDSEAVLARSRPKNLVSTNKDLRIPLDDPKKPEVWPLLLHGREELVVLGASFQQEPPEEHDEFPSSAVIYNT